MPLTPGSNIAAARPASADAASSSHSGGVAGEEGDGDRALGDGPHHVGADHHGAGADPVGEDAAEEDERHERRGPDGKNVPHAGDAVDRADREGRGDRHHRVAQQRHHPGREVEREIPGPEPWRDVAGRLPDDDRGHRLHSMIKDSGGVPGPRTGAAGDILGYIRAMPNRVVALLGPVQEMYPVTCASAVFGDHGPDIPRHYDFRLCAERPGPVRTTMGADIVVEAGLEALQPTPRRFSSPAGARARTARRPVCGAVLAAHTPARRRIVAVCAGIHVPARLGLLDWAHRRRALGDHRLS